jgi:guanylate kinase
MPPSEDELIHRLRNRGSDSEKRIAKRLERMELETSYQPKYDITVVNEKLDEAVTEILESIESINQVKEELWD